MNFIEERSIKQNNGCWLWKLSIGRDGYGRMKFKGKWYLAHRFSWELFNHKSAENLLVIHSCDNPACVNPDHLRLGTTKDNMQDCICRGRRGKTGGNGVVLTQETADSIRNESRNGTPKRKLAIKYRVSPVHIRAIIANTYWKAELSNPIPPPSEVSVSE